MTVGLISKAKYELATPSLLLAQPSMNFVLIGAAKYDRRFY
jgi:hypothetical protein